MPSLVRRSTVVALFSFIALLACGGGPPPDSKAAAPATPTSGSPEPAAAPVDCPATAPEGPGGPTCPTGCQLVGTKCLKQKGIVAPH